MAQQGTASKAHRRSALTASLPSSGASSRRVPQEALNVGKTSLFVFKSLFQQPPGPSLPQAPDKTHVLGAQRLAPPMGRRLAQYACPHPSCALQQMPQREVPFLEKGLSPGQGPRRPVRVRTGLRGPYVLGGFTGLTGSTGLGGLKDRTGFRALWDRTGSTGSTGSTVLTGLTGPTGSYGLIRALTGSYGL